jgi:hypothetical protein
VAATKLIQLTSQTLGIDMFIADSWAVHKTGPSQSSRAQI